MTDKIPGGYMLVAKKIFDSELMKKPPLYSKLFLWMLGQASYKETKDLKRGEFITNISAMQKAMTYYAGYRKEMPTIKQIRSIYNWFAKKPTWGTTGGTMVVTTKVTGGIKISISNYDYYQTASNYEGHDEGHNEKSTGGPFGGGIPFNKKERKNKCAKKSTPYTPEFEEVWTVYPNGKNKKQSFSRWCKMNGDRPDSQTLIAAIKSQMPDWEKDDFKYVPMFSTWLNNARWEDKVKKPLETNNPYPDLN